jgi:hypothetical protein
MAKTIMAVFSNPATPAQEDEYNTWYDEVHLKELLAIPGIVGATRYTIGDDSAHRYLATYEIEGDPAAVLAEMAARAPEMTLSPALDAGGARTVFWTPI